MYTAYFDGGSRGNPGSAAYGAIITDEAGGQIEIMGYLGTQTNNYAEYKGLQAVLEFAVETETKSIKVYSDSLLVVCQINKRWKIKDKALKEIWAKCNELIAHLDTFELLHVPRSQNSIADGLVNAVLDREAAFEDTDSK